MNAGRVEHQRIIETFVSSAVIFDRCLLAGGVIVRSGGAAVGD